MAIKWKAFEIKWTIDRDFQSLLIRQWIRISIPEITKIIVFSYFSARNNFLCILNSHIWKKYYFILINFIPFWISEKNETSIILYSSKDGLFFFGKFHIWLKIFFTHLIKNLLSLFVTSKKWNHKFKVLQKGQRAF